MSRLNRADGSFFTTVSPNVILGPNTPINDRTPINLIGRNKVSYGTAQNENFLWLTENFASRTEPAASIKGQLWYNTTNDDGRSGGELMIATSDYSPLLSDIDNEKRWVTVPVISEMTSDPVKSKNGRMIIRVGTPSVLKVRMDDQWYQLQTAVPSTYKVEKVLDIQYNNNIKDGSYQTYSYSLADGRTQTDRSVIAVFAEGGKQDELNGVQFITNDLGASLQWNTVYSWEADVIARSATDPSKSKVWKVSGRYYINKNTSTDTLNPNDPRIISAFNDDDVVYEVVDEYATTSHWQIKVERNTGIVAIADKNGVFNAMSASDLNDRISTLPDIGEGYYGGLKFVCVGNPGEELRWQIVYKHIAITGI